LQTNNDPEIRSLIGTSTTTAYATSFELKTRAPHFPHGQVCGLAHSISIEASTIEIILLSRAATARCLLAIILRQPDQSLYG